MQLISDWRNIPVVHHRCQLKDYLLSCIAFSDGDFQRLHDGQQERYDDKIAQVA